MKETKKCSLCNNEKPIALFYSNKAKQNGVYSRCIECIKLELKYPKSKEISYNLDGETFSDVYINGEYFPYLISSSGRVIIKKTNKQAKPSLDQRGYAQVCLVNENTRVSRRVHRLVASTFIDNPLNKREVNHIDGDKLNNHISNLEWVTSKENVEHAINTGLRK